MMLTTRRRAFTLLEIFVVLGIIACLLALLVPFFLRLREGGRTGQCVRNMQAIGKAITDYAKDHQDQLPGPLSTDQYPVASAGQPPRDGQLLKHIGKYLEQPANSPDGAGNASTIFTYPAWQRNSDRTTDSPVFLINNETAAPFGQPVWGGAGKAPLKISQFAEWRRVVSGKEAPAEPAKIWALTEADREIAKIIGIKEPWVQRMPPRALHYNHRNALYFDWHVDNLTL
jgi:prepilin-type processing-associated H-X9-DG protein